MVSCDMHAFMARARGSQNSLIQNSGGYKPACLHRAVLCPCRRAPELPGLPASMEVRSFDRAIASKGACEELWASLDLWARLGSYRFLKYELSHLASSKIEICNMGYSVNLPDYTGILYIYIWHIASPVLNRLRGERMK